MRTLANNEDTDLQYLLIQNILHRKKSNIFEYYNLERLNKNAFNGLILRNYIKPYGNFHWSKKLM